MEMILGPLVGLYLAIGFVVLFYRLRERSARLNAANPCTADPWAWIVVAALWPLYFRDQRRTSETPENREEG